MAVRELRRVVKNQNRETAAGGEPFLRRRKVVCEDVCFADSIVAKEAIRRLGVNSVLAGPRRRCSLYYTPPRRVRCRLCRIK